MGEQLAEHGVADPARMTGCADHRDRTRAQQTLDRSRIGDLCSLLDRGQRLRSRLDGQLDLHDPVLEPAAHRETGLGEHTEHPPVLRQDRRREPRDAGLTRRHGEVLQENGGDPPAMMLVVDEERDLGVTPGAIPVVAGDPDQIIADQPDEPEAIDVIDTGEPVDVGSGQGGTGREEAEVDALR